MTADDPFPTVTGAFFDPELAGGGWEGYGRLAAIKGAISDLASDVARHHIEADAPLDDAMIQYERWLLQEVGRSFAAVSESIGAFDSRDPTNWSDFDELVLAAEQGIAAVAVAARRSWDATGLGNARAFLALYQRRVLLFARRAFENQLIAASFNAPPGPGGQL